MKPIVCLAPDGSLEVWNKTFFDCWLAEVGTHPMAVVFYAWFMDDREILGEL